jgi:hypothetical protein
MARHPVTVITPLRGGSVAKPTTPRSKGSLLRDALYRDLGAGHLDAIHRHRGAKSLVRRLNALGFDVNVRPAAA